MSQAPEDKTSLMIQQLMQKAEGDLSAERFQAALDSVTEAKAIKQKVYGLDYLRGRIMLGMGREIEAYIVLREELHHFPDHGEAKQLLSELKPVTEQYPDLNDPFFHSLFGQILPYTMVTEKRLVSLYQLSRKVCEGKTTGAFVECGVAAGGTTALLASVIKRFSDQERLHYAFDTFTGMPEPDERDVSFDGLHANKAGWGAGTCSAPEEVLARLCESLGVMDYVKPVPGYFQDTLPVWRDKIGDIAFLHMDGDWYESTHCILEQLFDQLVPGAIVQVDDYGYWRGCQQAVDNYLEQRGLNLKMNRIDMTGVWFELPAS